jgi:transcriptional regulator with XRE-family HTH domain
LLYSYSNENILSLIVCSVTFLKDLFHFGVSMDPYALSDKAWGEELGRRLDRLRESRGLSRDALGEEMGVSQPTLRRLLDRGEGKLESLISALRALEAMDDLDSLIREPKINPAKFHRIIDGKAAGKAVLSTSATAEVSSRKKTNVDDEGDLGW